MLKKILIAPLNWGLGHATRCIPIIKALEKQGFIPIIASDGTSLDLLKKEFPHLTHLELPSYGIRYSEKRETFKLKLVSQLPKIMYAVFKEKKIVQQWIKEYSISGIISDNRLGVYSNEVPSVFITHQLNVLTGNTSWLTTKLHHYYIENFNKCWVPDKEGSPNLSGKLGHLEKPLKNVEYIGPLSRFNKRDLELKYDLMILLSGPEPQRTILEEKLLLELKHYPNKVLFIKGIIEAKQNILVKGNITFYNFMKREQLEIAFNESNSILCRSGYTSIMDIASLEKKAFFIPTPGQFEQEYLAKKLKKEGIAPYCKQNKFTVDKLDKIDLYRGLKNYASETNWKELFSIFAAK